MIEMMTAERAAELVNSGEDVHSFDGLRAVRCVIKDHRVIVLGEGEDGGIEYDEIEIESYDTDEVIKVEWYE